MSNETALIIGGSKGMALDTAKRLAARGIDLILVPRGEQGLKDAVSDIGNNVNVETVILDLYDLVAVSDFAKRIEADKRHIKYLVNAAGYFNPVPFLDHTREDYKAYMDVNEALFFISQAVAKNMKAAVRIC